MNRTPHYYFFSQIHSANLFKFDFSSNIMLRFDGIYQYKHERFTQYLKFFEDGTVIAVEFSLSPFQMGDYLKNDAQKIGINRGTYSIKDEKIFFSFKMEGSVASYAGENYNGEISEDKIFVRIENIKHVFDKRGYSFIPYFTPSKKSKGLTPPGPPT